MPSDITGKQYSIYGTAGLQRLNYRVSTLNNVCHRLPLHYQVVAQISNITLGSRVPFVKLTQNALTPLTNHNREEPP